MQCAEVSTSVADRSWTCGHCLPLSVCSRTTTSSARAARLMLKKKLLEEQQAMEKRHLVEKYKMLEEELHETDDSVSNRSKVSRRTSLDRVKHWQQQCDEQSDVSDGLPLVGQSADTAAAALNSQGQIDSGKTMPEPTDEVNKLIWQKLATDATRRQELRHAEHRQQSSFKQPQLNSTLKPFGVPERCREERYQQQYTGAIPKIGPKQQQVTNPRGKVEPQVPPITHQG